MKLTAEIQAECGDILRLCASEETLEVLICQVEGLNTLQVKVPLAEFREALNAVAPPTRPRIKTAEEIGASHRSAVDAIGEVYRPSPPTRDASGARIGESPRFSMRAMKPEANVAVAYERVEDEGGTAA